MDTDSASITLDPQKVAFPYTDDDEWVYVQGENGDGGWLWMEEMEETDEKDAYFDGLFFCD